MPERSFSRLERTAYHEAGHAVMGFLLKRRVLSVSIAPLDDGSRGRCNYAPTDPKLLRIDGETTARQRRTIERLIMCTLAGVLAEQLATGVENAISKDWPKAQEHARRVTSSDAEADAYVAWLRVRSEALLAQPAARAMVAAVAEALVNHGPELSGVKAHRVAAGALRSDRRLL
jgi:ATP-dependent Zn protease